MVRNDWRNMSQKEKKKYEDDYEKEKYDLSLNIDNSDKLAEYEEKLKKYHEQLKEDKEKILRKYGITSESKAKQRRLHREEERQKKRAGRRLETEQRRQEVKEQKRKIREAKLKKLKEEKDIQRKAKEEAKRK